MSAIAFKRRTIPAGQLFRDSVQIMRDRKRIQQAMRNQSISAEFRERLMLAVTAVNDCRYCSYAHTRKALESGMSEEEIHALNGGEFEHSPDLQVPALLYAQHWAETDGRVSAAARQKMIGKYGEANLSDIEMILRMIRMGNMLGNSWDCFLYRISFGRWGGFQE